MAGRPGRSGGHNRISLEAHVLRGTFNPTRHAPETPLGSRPWQPPPAALAALGAAGRAFLRRQRARYAFTPLEGEVALEMAVIADRLAELRATRADVKAIELDGLDKRERDWQRAYVTGVCWLRSRAKLTRPTARTAPARKWAGLL